MRAKGTWLVGLGARVGVGIVGGEIEHSAERWRGFQREGIALLVGSRGEGIRTVVEHSLGKSTPMRGCLNAEVAEHGVRPPPAHEADVVGVNARHHQRGCSPRTEGAG